jgi:hypothetical protein
MKQIEQLMRMAERARKAAQNLSDPELRHRQASLAEAFAAQAAVLKNQKSKTKKKTK